MSLRTLISWPASETLKPTPLRDFVSSSFYLNSELLRPFLDLDSLSHQSTFEIVVRPNLDEMMIFHMRCTLERRDTPKYSDLWFGVFGECFGRFKYLFRSISQYRCLAKTTFLDSFQAEESSRFL